MHINLSPFPVLSSTRLILRKLNDTDSSDVLILRSDPQTMQFIPRPLCNTEEEARNHIEEVNEGASKNQMINWAINLKGENQVIGMIGLFRMQPENFRTELGYILHPKFRGKGIMAEAVTLVLNYALYELDFHSVEAVIDPRNIASERVLLAQGFLKEAHLRENKFYNVSFYDTAIYSILKRDYRRKF